MKCLLSLVAIVLSLDSFGFYTLRYNTLDTTYEWGDKATWANNNQPTNIVSDSFFCSTGSAIGDATRTYVNSGYYVDFREFGMARWAGQTNIVYVGENSYIGVRDATYTMNYNDAADLPSYSYSELHLTNSMLKVYNSDGSTTGRILDLGDCRYGTAILDLQNGSVYTNGTEGAMWMSSRVGSYTHLNIEDSSFFAPYGQLILNKVGSSQVRISMRNGHFESVPPPGSTKLDQAALTTNSGDVLMQLDHSDFVVTSGMSSGGGYDFCFFGLEGDLTDIRAVNGSLISLTNPHVDENTTYGCLCFHTIGRVNFVLEDSTFISGGICFDNQTGKFPESTPPSHFELRGKSTWQTLGHRVIDPAAHNFRCGAEMFLWGGALDVTLCLVPASRGLLLDWMYTTNGCSVVKSIGDTGLGASLALYPDGGFQVIRTNAIELVRFLPEASVKTITDGGPLGGTYTTSIGESKQLIAHQSGRATLCKDLFWQGGTGDDHIGEAFGSDPDGVRYGVVFKDTAAVALDETFDARASGYAVLPAYEAARVKSASLSFALTPQGTNTLAGIAARMTAAGYAAEVIDEEGYTIRANVPPKLLADGTLDGRVWFDFTYINGMDDAQSFNVETKALVTKINFTVVKRGGLKLIFR